MINYTIVLGVDAGHLDQLEMSWATWAAFKPSLLKKKLVVFYDSFEVTREQIHARINPKPTVVNTFAWPLSGICRDHYGMPTDDKWTNPQRAMMLSGFVHVPAMCVDTPYWLKLDLDVIATGMDDWIDPHWFDSEPAIVSHPWGYTKPPDQMMKLDQWVMQNSESAEFRAVMQGTSPLNLFPQPTSNAVVHPRIISWCGFFHTGFTALCSSLATVACGRGRLPVPSQDGYMWYLATRLGKPVVRARMKTRGWEHHNGTANVRRAAGRAFSMTTRH